MCTFGEQEVNVSTGYAHIAESAPQAGAYALGKAAVTCLRQVSTTSGESTAEAAVRITSLRSADPCASVTSSCRQGSSE
jgi:hypothetical protein